MALDEFGLIDRYFRRAVPVAGACPQVALGVGDDAALLLPPAGEAMAISTDTLVAGHHFPFDALPYDIGWKSLAVNLSDLAAMAARPLGVTLALTLPEADEAWLASFSEGFFALADAHGVPLIGGDTTRGPLAITVTALGAVPVGQALRRDGASPGDLIFVSGHVGDAGLGLALALGHDAGWLADLPPAHRALALARLHRPTPRLALGLALRGLASAALDVSDGLLQDLGHLLAASGSAGRPLGARLTLESLPLSPALHWLAGADARSQRQAAGWALSAGDDYELLFTVAAGRRGEVEALAHRLALPLTCVGELTADAGLCLTLDGRAWEHELPAGYQHFRGAPDV